MNEILATVGGSIRWIDLIDVLLVSYIVYRVLLLIRGTRAVQMLTGLGVLGVAFVISIRAELFTLHWLLSYFFDSLILIIIVLFQDDLRRALTHVGKNPFFSGGTTSQEEREMVEEIARAASKLAIERIGALIVIERENGLKDFIDTGARVDAKVRAELIYSVFIPSSPIHDGAVIISNGRVAAAGCFLPLSKDPDIEKKLGTRHRAAIGLTQETDAIVVLVSEEAGQASIVKAGKMTGSLTEDELRSSLAVLLELFDSAQIRKKLAQSRSIGGGTDRAS